MIHEGSEGSGLRWKKRGVYVKKKKKREKDHPWWQKEGSRHR